MPSSSSIQKNNRPEKWPRKHFRITPQWRQWFFKLYLKCVQPYITSIGLLWYSIQAPNFKLFLILSIVGKLYVSCLRCFSVDTINHPDLREKGIFLVYYSEGYSQSWQGRHDITQSRHGGRVKRLAFHIAFTLRKQRVNRKLDQPIKSPGLPPVTTCFFKTVSLLKVPQHSKQRISWGLSTQTQEHRGDISHSNHITPSTDDHISPVWRAKESCVR